MQELSRQSLMNIHDIIHGQSYVNIKAKLDLLLPEEYANTFSKIKILGQYGIWYGKDNISYYQYSEATQQEKEEIAIWIEDCKTYVCEILRDTMPFVDSLFIIPSKEQILWYRCNGNIRALLTQWGFQTKMSYMNVDVIGLLIQEPRTIKQQDVSIHIDYSDGLPANTTSFCLNSFNNILYKETDEDGNCYLGKIFANKVFSIENIEKTNHYDYTVEVGKSMYNVVFDYIANYSVVIENYLREPEADYSFILNGNHVQTDDNGTFYGKTILTKGLSISVEVDNKNYTFELHREEDQNRFVICLDKNEIIEPQVVKDNIIISLLDIDGKPLPDLPFVIKTKKGLCIESQTNSEGKAVIERKHFSNKEKYHIYFSISEEYRKQLDDIKGKDGK